MIGQHRFNFMPRPPLQHDEVECPGCKVWSVAATWRETEVWCELCDDTHECDICPSCNRVFDGNYFEPDINVRSAS